MKTPNRATGFVSTFSVANPMNMVALNEIEPLTCGFSTHVAPKSQCLRGLPQAFELSATEKPQAF
jgi:hypothetical protein